MVGLKVPMVNMVHQYLVTESIPEVSSLQKEIPVVRDPWSSCYYRQEQQGLVIGPYEMNAEAWGLDVRSTAAGIGCVVAELRYLRDRAETPDRAELDAWLLATCTALLDRWRVAERRIDGDIPSHLDKGQP